MHHTHRYTSLGLGVQCTLFTNYILFLDTFLSLYIGHAIVSRLMETKLNFTCFVLTQEKKTNSFFVARSKSI